MSVQFIKNEPHYISEVEPEEFDGVDQNITRSISIEQNISLKEESIEEFVKKEPHFYIEDDADFVDKRIPPANQRPFIQNEIMVGDHVKKEIRYFSNHIIEEDEPVEKETQGKPSEAKKTKDRTICSTEDDVYPATPQNMEDSTIYHHRKLIFKCEDCHYVTSYQSTFQRHRRVHTGEKPFKCDICPFTASLNGNLYRHKKVHSSEKAYKCNVCSFATAHKTNLQMHMKVHTGEKPYKCDICSFAAAHKSNLQIHKRIHTGEKPYKCDFCSYASTKKVNLQAHIKVHTKIKPYNCDICSFASVFKTDLQKHKIIHTLNSNIKEINCPYPELM